MRHHEDSSDEQLLASAPAPLPPLKVFDDVRAAELSYICTRREALTKLSPETEPKLSSESPTTNLVGLAMSGGGIRSAIFNLGVLQALHRDRVFPHLDYISTVSGGGYIGTCLSVLMRTPGSPFPFSDRSEILTWLRNRSQYLGTRGLWLRAGSILLLGLFANLVTLAPVLLLASFLIALYGRFRLTDLLPQLEQPRFDPLLVLAALFAIGAIRSAFESLLRALIWPWILQVELSIKHAPELGPKDDRRARRFATIFRRAVTFLKSVPVTKFLGRTLDELADVPPAWLAQDWSLVAKKSLAARRIFRRDLEKLVIVVAIFAGLELQPFLLRLIHTAPRITRGAFSIDFWTATISLVAAIASLFAIGGSRVGGLALDRFARYVAAVSGPLGLYLLCLLTAERLLFYLPAKLWTLEYWLPRLNPGSWLIADVTSFVKWALALVILYLVLLWLLLDLNDRSIHGFYRDSLSDTFVASDDVTGIVEPAGDLRLSELNQVGSAAPYQLFNATLNLQGDPDLRNTGRHGDFFLMTRDCFGSERTGYAPMSALELRYGTFTVASAMATSGAAASPHMGVFSRRPFVFIMSLFNIRLGCWLPNPTSLRGRLPGRPGFWRPNPLWLFHEFFGHLHAKGPGIYVSDGGHLDNTGVFQLLKRRCRTIIAIDASTDSKMQLSSLADLKRYARVDLGIEIEIDVAPLRLNKDGLTGAHWIAGTIHYPVTDKEPACRGEILLIKSSLTGDEGPEIQAYKAARSDFPHEPLADQFFEEAQFEAYRLLGRHAAEECLREREALKVARPQPAVTHCPSGRTRRASGRRLVRVR